MSEFSSYWSSEYWVLLCFSEQRVMLGFSFNENLVKILNFELSPSFRVTEQVKIGFCYDYQTTELLYWYHAIILGARYALRCCNDAKS